MNLDAKTATEEAGYIEKLGKVGIPLVYVDFREKPMENTEASMRIMGKLFGKETKAEDFIKFRADSIARVTDVLAKTDMVRSRSSSSSAPAAIPTIAACRSATRISARWSRSPAA